MTLRQLEDQGRRLRDLLARRGIAVSAWEAEYLVAHADASKPKEKPDA